MKCFGLGLINIENMVLEGIVQETRSVSYNQRDTSRKGKDHKGILNRVSERPY